MDNTEKLMNFEQAIAKLESIVAEMESNDIALDAALSRYEEGISLIRFCQNTLEEAQQKIKILDPERDILKDFALNEA